MCLCEGAGRCSAPAPCCSEPRLVRAPCCFLPTFSPPRSSFISSKSSIFTCNLILKITWAKMHNKGNTYKDACWRQAARPGHPHFTDGRQRVSANTKADVAEPRANPELLRPGRAVLRTAVAAPRLWLSHKRSRLHVSSTKSNYSNAWFPFYNQSGSFINSIYLVGKV